jgi:hypothetical protein
MRSHTSQSHFPSYNHFEVEANQFTKKQFTITTLTNFNNHALNCVLRRSEK